MYADRKISTYRSVPEKTVSRACSHHRCAYTLPGHSYLASNHHAADIYIYIFFTIVRNRLGGSGEIVIVSNAQQRVKQRTDR